MASRKKSIQTVEFHSVGDFIAAADTEPGDKTSHNDRDPEFAGTETWAEAISLATHGWPAGVERLQTLRASLDHVVQKAVTAKCRSLRFAESGDYLDVGRYLSGEPEAFGTYVEADESHSSGRVIKLVANVSAMGRVGSESIFSAGAAIYAAIDLLETLGHRVELWLGSGSKSNDYHRPDDRLQVLVLCKPASQPFDPDRLAFFLCNNASLRRLFFSVEIDHNFPPNGCKTSPLELGDDAIVTPEVKEYDNTHERRVQRLLSICETCGVTFTSDEAEAITH